MIYYRFSIVLLSVLYCSGISRGMKRKHEKLHVVYGIPNERDARVTQMRNALDEYWEKWYAHQKLKSKLRRSRLPPEKKRELPEFPPVLKKELQEMYRELFASELRKDHYWQMDFTKDNVPTISFRMSSKSDMTVSRYDCHGDEKKSYGSEIVLKLSDTKAHWAPRLILPVIKNCSEDDLEEPKKNYVIEQRIHFYETPQDGQPAVRIYEMRPYMGKSSGYRGTEPCPMVPKLCGQGHSTKIEFPELSFERSWDIIMWNFLPGLAACFPPLERDLKQVRMKMPELSDVCDKNVIEIQAELEKYWNSWKARYAPVRIQNDDKVDRKSKKKSLKLWRRQLDMVQKKFNSNCSTWALTFDEGNGTPIIHSHDVFTLSHYTEREGRWKTTKEYLVKDTEVNAKVVFHGCDWKPMLILTKKLQRCEWEKGDLAECLWEDEFYPCRIMGKNARPKGTFKIYWTDEKVCSPKIKADSIRPSENKVRCINTKTCPPFIKVGDTGEILSGPNQKGQVKVFWTKQKKSTRVMATSLEADTIARIPLDLAKIDYQRLKVGVEFEIVDYEGHNPSGVQWKPKRQVFQLQLRTKNVHLKKPFLSAIASCFGPLSKVAVDIDNVETPIERREYQNSNKRWRIHDSSNFDVSCNEGNTIIHFKEEDIIFKVSERWGLVLLSVKGKPVANPGVEWTFGSYLGSRGNEIELYTKAFSKDDYYESRRKLEQNEKFQRDFPKPKLAALECYYLVFENTQCRRKFEYALVDIKDKLKNIQRKIREKMKSDSSDSDEAIAYVPSYWSM